jgi:hypothetical protein
MSAHQLFLTSTEKFNKNNKLDAGAGWMAEPGGVSSYPSKKTAAGRRRTIISIGLPASATAWRISSLPPYFLCMGAGILCEGA